MERPGVDRESSTLAALPGTDPACWKELGEGVLGAGAGCVIGHHEATKNAQKKPQQQGPKSDTQGNTNSEY
jgi:hypothetical protein